MGCKWIVANFPVDKYKLSGEDLEDRQLKIKKELGELIEFINFGVNKRIIGLEGRASETGPPSDPRAESRSSVEYNLDLSKKRALEVARELRRLGLTYHIPIAPLGQTRPLPVSATGRFPRPGEENGQNRSVVIFYRKPPIAIARILPADHVHPPSWSGEFSYWRVTIGSNRTQVHVVLDGTKSQPGRTPVEGDYNYRTPLENKSEPPSIKEYKWEQLESNNERRVRDSILKWNEVDQPTTTVAIERNRVSAGSRLRFRLTVKDDQNLEASDTITIYMDISQQPAQQREPPVRRKANWGLKMRGSISLDAFRIGLRGRVGPVTPGIQARVGGLFAVGQLKYVPDDRVVTIAFIGGGVKAAAGIGIGGNPAGPYRESVFGQRIREILGFGGVSIDDPREDYTPFYCPVHEASRFRGPATIKGADIRAGFYVGMSQEKAKIDFHYADTDPEDIEIGGLNFITTDTLVGAETGAQLGIVFILSDRDITGFIDHGLSWFAGTFERGIPRVGM